MDGDCDYVRVVCVDFAAPEGAARADFLALGFLEVEARNADGVGAVCLAVKAGDWGWGACVAEFHLFVAAF